MFSVAIVFGQTYRHELLEWDDTAHIVHNPHVNPPSWAGLLNTWRRPFFNLYVPVTYTFFSGEAWLAQSGEALASTATDPISLPAPALDARVFHLGNLCLHAGNVLLVYVLLLRFLGHRGGACTGALLFALHPVQVESVAWVSETRGLLAALFSLLAALAYLRGVDEDSYANAKSWQRRAAWYVIATIGFALALLSKPSAAALPLVLLVLQGLLLARSEHFAARRMAKATLWLVPWFLLAVALSLVNKSQQSGEVIRFVPTPAERLLIAGDALTFYLTKLFVPWPLAAAYGHSARQVLEDPLLWPKALAPLVLAVPLAWLRPRAIWLAGAGVFLAALVPVLGLVPFGYEDISTVADRYMYLALLGPALVVAYFASNRWSTATIAVCGSVAALLALASAWQASYWTDQETLFAQCLWASPPSYIAHDKVGLAYLERREAAAAAEHFQIARDIDPTYAITYNNLGSAYRQLQRFEDAAAQYQLALDLDPAYTVARFNLGNVCLRDLDRLDDARDCFEAVIRANPRFAPAHLNLGVARLRQGDAAAALPLIEEALRLKPDDPETLFTQGHVLWQLGRRPEALASLEQAFRRNPAEQRYLMAWQKYQREAQQSPTP